MIFRIIASILVLIHGLFILYVLFGAFLNFKWPKMIWIHLPMVIWGALVEYMHWICPLTPLENYFRQKARTGVYEGDFIEHYIIPLIYPENLTPQFQVVFGSLVVVLNLVVYGFFWYHIRRKK
ncbi:MAG: DUF2784 domain-containing protein [Marinilabiliaceae bacterium]|nr:DUF2784 domain-containing protein [Marinilabiliaceae bacterium]